MVAIMRMPITTTTTYTAVRGSVLATGREEFSHHIQRTERADPDPTLNLYADPGSNPDPDLIELECIL
jgi:hypothetical protein